MNEGVSSAKVRSVVRGDEVGFSMMRCDGLFFDSLTFHSRGGGSDLVSNSLTAAE